MQKHASHTPPPPAANHYRIGEAARLSGVSAANIRHYEREGLLASSVRADNLYRYYSDADVHSLRLIRLCRSLDMSLAEIAQIMQLDETNAQDCRQAIEAIAEHLAHVRTRIGELQLLEQKLDSLLHVCDGRGQTCHLIETLHHEADRLTAQDGPAPSARPRHV